MRVPLRGKYDEEDETHAQRWRAWNSELNQGYRGEQRVAQEGAVFVRFDKDSVALATSSLLNFPMHLSPFKFR